MIAIIAVIIIAILAIYSISNKSKGKQEEGEKPEVTEIKPTVKDKKLTNLKVYCCGGLELKRGQATIVTNEEATYEVKGFNIKGEELILEPNQVTWGKSCPVVKLRSETGLINIISCSNKGKLNRNVWVRYSNGVGFGWTIQFK